MLPIRCKKIKKLCTSNNTIYFSSLILNAIMVAFKPSYISSRAMQFLEIINSSTEDDLPSYLSLCTFGLCISECPPPTEQRRQILGLVWKHISTINIPEHYISCVEVWMSFTMQHVSVSIIKYIFSENVVIYSANLIFLESGIEHHIR